MKAKIAFLATLASIAVVFKSGEANAAPQTYNINSWRVENKASSGPLLRVDLPDSKGKRRTVFVVVEYARQCEPIFSYVELTGNRLGAAKSQAALNNSKIGIVLNGKFHTWHAAATTYDNGFEAGFGIPNDLVLQLLVNLDSLAYITPSGETIPLPTTDFQRGFQTAIDMCKKRVR